MRRLAWMALALALCGTAAHGSPKKTPIGLAQAARSGIDLKAPVELVFQWRTSQLPAPALVDAVTQLLARHGFAVTVTPEQTAPPVAYAHTIIGRRTAVTRQAEVDALGAQLAPLVGGPGATRWSVAQDR